MTELLVVVFLIALNAFFAVSEMSLMTSRKLRLKQMAEDPDHPSRGARKALALAEHPDNLLSTVQVGITLITILTGVLASKAIGGVEGDPMVQCIGVIATLLYSGVGTLIILKLIDWTMGLRVSTEDEQDGLDISQHAERVL